MNLQTNSCPDNDDRLTLSEVTFSYNSDGDHPALCGFNMTFEPGRIVIITGPSGSGKSTLLYLAAGVYPHNAGMLLSGEVRLGQVCVSDEIPERRVRSIGMMFQNPDLQFCMDTVENELIFCLENIGTAQGEMNYLASEALSFCDIAHLRNRRLAELSGGEKQKAMLACLVCINPKWLLLDEPFANIDGTSALEIAGKLKQLCKERGTGIVTVDHKLDIWLDIADEIRVLAPGGGIALQDISPQGELDVLPAYGVDVPSHPYREESASIPTGTPTKPASVPVPSGKPILSLSNVSVSVDAKKLPIVSGVNAEFASGQIHAILGVSGSGKSTLLEALCGFRKYEGHIKIGGDEVRRIPRKELGKRIGFVFQNPQDQFVSSSVYDEIIVGLKGRGDIADRDAAAEQILRDVGLWRYRQFSPYMLSQGEQRRLAVAALLVYRCRILICDEPTYAQDLHSLTAIMNELKHQVDEEGLTLLYSTHDKKLARDYADHIYFLGEGGLREIDQSDL